MVSPDMIGSFRHDYCCRSSLAKSIGSTKAGRGKLNSQLSNLPLRIAILSTNITNLHRRNRDQTEVKTHHEVGHPARHRGGDRPRRRVREA